jgi:hypothetical protein
VGEVEMAEIFELELDPNQKIMARYLELGQIIKNAKAEQDAMKPELVEAIEAGESFTLGDARLTLIDKETVTCNWKRIVGDKKLTQEEMEPYLTRTMSRYPSKVKL